MTRWMIAIALTATALCATAQSVEAEVRKVDKAQGKVTLKHGEIKKLDMPAMTMVFKVRDPKMLDGLNVGDKIKIDADKLDGQYTVTALSKGG
ncbi:MAG: copper-binding protein [Rubrivivax sp.]|nr:copper-binding protein [Rubrivivax sp.]